MRHDLQVCARGNIMTFVNDRESGRVTDLDSGQYLTWSTENRETGDMYFIIHGADGHGLFGAFVRYCAINETGVGGSATVIKFVLQKSWIPTGRKEPPMYSSGHRDLVDRLERFLKVWKYFGGAKTPDPRFEFIDSRLIEGIKR